jgi:hypothetical protein
MKSFGGAEPELSTRRGDFQGLNILGGQFLDFWEWRCTATSLLNAARHLLASGWHITTIPYQTSSNRHASHTSNQCNNYIYYTPCSIIIMMIKAANISTGAQPDLSSLTHFE